MVNQYNGRQFSEYFYYGIEDKQKVIDYIIYASLEKSHRNLSEHGDLYEIPNEEHMKDWIRLSKPEYKQFYRFIVLADNPKNTSYKADDEEEKNIYKAINSRIQYHIKNGNINEFKAGFYFSRGIEQEFIQSERYNYYCDSRGWICVIYKFLEELNELEKENKDLYELKWLKVRIIRAINRNPLDKEELKKLLETCQASEAEIKKLRTIIEKDR